jgi:two-component sensor histidine kinase
MKLWPNWTDWRRPTAPTEREARETAPPDSGRSLRFRLLLTIVVWLVPAAVLSVMQGLDRVYRDVEDVRERLVQTARATATDEQNVLASAEQILRSLANQPEVRSGSPDCDQGLASALRGLSFFVNIARYDSGGNMSCSALRPSEPVRASSASWWSEAQSQSGFFITRPMRHPITGTMAISGILPLRDPSLKFDGVLQIDLDVQWLDFMLRVQQLPQGAVAAIFDSSGALLASNNDQSAVQIFREPVSLANMDRLFAATTPVGESWSYAVAPLLGSTTFIAFAMRDADLFRDTYLHVGTDLLFPVLILALVAGGIWFATDRLVIRWLDYLRRIAAAYARGHYTIRPALNDAPSEFRTLGNALNLMADAVQERDRSLREAVAQKTMLIRETHHRVKNNMQIVMSLLSLQAGQLRDPAAKEALRQAQVRVNALALVHRILHELEDQDSVDLKRLITDLTQQIHEGFGAERRDLRIELDLASCRVPGDAAVPITLFTLEALTNAFKHAFPQSSRGGLIRISLLPIENEQLRLTIEDNGVGTREEKSGGIGSRLIKAFGQQVGGTVSVEPRAGQGTAVCLIFPDPRRKETTRQAAAAVAG